MGEKVANCNDFGVDKALKRLNEDQISQYKCIKNILFEFEQDICCINIPTDILNIIAFNSIGKIVFCKECNISKTLFMDDKCIIIDNNDSKDYETCFICEFCNNNYCFQCWGDMEPHKKCCKACLDYKNIMGKDYDWPLKNRFNIRFN